MNEQDAKAAVATYDILATANKNIAQFEKIKADPRAQFVVKIIDGEGRAELSISSRSSTPMAIQNEARRVAFQTIERGLQASRDAACRRLAQLGCDVSVAKAK